MRDATGRGEKVDVAMIDAMASLLTFNAGIFFAGGKSPVRRGNAHPTIVPYETFRAADGWLNIAVANDALWRRFCEACDRGDLVDDPKFARAADRVANRTILVPIVETMIAAKPRGYWTDRLSKAGVPCGAIKTVGEVCTDPALLARGKIKELAHPTAGAVRVVDTPISFSSTHGGADAPPPLLGQHTRDVLRDLAGLSTVEIDTLVAQGAARCADEMARD
jgi:crotonobetainyl-CoA:carnitine CoA-transferase CaiB-like acyl-CoA transferase